MAYFSSGISLGHHAGDQLDEQKTALAQRRHVHRLFYQQGYSKTEIARRLGLSKAFVVRWTQSPDQDLEADGRGWPKGQSRRWQAGVSERIARLHAELVADPREFFTGASAIQQRYRQRYPGEPLPPLRTIGRMLAERGLSQRHKRGRSKGAARYLCYPEHTLYQELGQRVLEADFVGHKYLAGRSAPVNFLGFAFKKAPRLRYFYRVEAQNSAVLIRTCERFFTDFETPQVLKVDNAAAALGSVSGKRSLSRFVHFLLTRQITPVFAVPRKPFSQASIEGNNSVFARKFWNTQQFSSLEDLDRRLAWFNDSSLAYTGYQPPPAPPSGPFVPRVYFIRQVREHPDDPQRGRVEVLNETIDLPGSYIQYFVLAEWHLPSEQLNILFEREQTAATIHSIPFAINPNSRYKPV